MLNVVLTVCSDGFECFLLLPDHVFDAHDVTETSLHLIA